MIERGVILNPFESFFDNLLEILMFFVEPPVWTVLVITPIFFICLIVSILLYRKWIPKLKNEEIEKINSEYNYLEKVCTDRVDGKIIDIVQTDECHFYPVVSFEYRGQRYSSQLKQYILFNTYTDPGEDHVITKSRKSNDRHNNNDNDIIFTEFLVAIGFIIIFLDALRNLFGSIKINVSVSDLYYKMGNTLPICINPFNLNEIYSPLLLNELRYHLDTNPIRNKKLYFLESFGTILVLITIIFGVLFAASFETWLFPFLNNYVF